jgi:hypothetical protein
MSAKIYARWEGHVNLDDEGSYYAEFNSGTGKDEDYIIRQVIECNGSYYAASRSGFFQNAEYDYLENPFYAERQNSDGFETISMEDFEHVWSLATSDKQ